MKLKHLLMIYGAFLANTNVNAANIAALNEQTQNPVAALTTVPLQNNWTFKIGPEKRTQYVLNVQPVIPKQININWNLITRIVMPVVSQPQMAANVPGDFGIANTGFSFFFSPINNHDFIFGLGPIITVPATSHALGSSKFGAGPTIVALVQKNLWTVGALVNQVWTIGGTKDANSINSLFVQPFISRSFWQSWNFAFTSETTVNWNRHGVEKWTIPLDIVIVKLFTVGKQIMSLGAGPRYFPLLSGVHSKWGGRIVLSFLFPN